MNGLTEEGVEGLKFEIWLFEGLKTPSPFVVVVVVLVFFSLFFRGGGGGKILSSILGSKVERTF